MTLELCHVFVFVPDRAAARDHLGRLGLAAAFERSHPGQGTANVCVAFDNAYLELLWAEDEAELVSAPVVRTRLAERAHWRETGASPFGIGLRNKMPFPSWEYRPPYLPEGAAIPVALASEDPRQPFIFRSPGGARPDAAVPGQVITGLDLHLPVAASPALKTLAERQFLTLTPAVSPRMDVTIAGPDGARVLRLPEFSWA